MPDIENYLPGRIGATPVVTIKQKTGDTITGGGGGGGTTSPSGAYKTVAPQNSGLIADYYTDGVADDVEIQAALASLPANGGTVQLTEGNFTTAATITLTAQQRLIGRGVEATKILIGSNSYDGIRMGNRQADAVMRNWMELAHMTVTAPGGASTKACVKIDGGGRGTTIKSVKTNEGAYGFELMDCDRLTFIDLDANNFRTAGIFCEVGLENTYGTITFINPSMACSDANSTCMLFGANADQASPNAFDRINVIGALFFSTNGLAGTTGIKANVGIGSMIVQGSLFESPIYHVILNSKSDLTVEACSFIQNSGVSTDGFQFNTDNHKLTIISCRFQQMTNLFNGVSGFTNICMLGMSDNEGNITNQFTGQFGAKYGTDTQFVGSGVLEIGGDNEPLSNVQAINHYFTKTTAPGTSTNRGALYYRSSDSKLVWKNAAGTETILA